MDDGKIFFGMPYKFKALPLLRAEWLRFVIREDYAKHYARCFSYELYPKNNGKLTTTFPYVIDLDGKRRPFKGSINPPST